MKLLLAMIRYEVLLQMRSVRFRVAVVCYTVICALPSALIVTVAAVGLSGALATALKNAVQEETLLFPALVTFLVAQSDVSFFGLGGAFWGLILGLGLWGLSRGRG